MVKKEIKRIEGRLATLARRRQQLEEKIAEHDRERLRLEALVRDSGYPNTRSLIEALTEFALPKRGRRPRLRKTSPAAIQEVAAPTPPKGGRRSKPKRKPGSSASRKRAPARSKPAAAEPLQLVAMRDEIRELVASGASPTSVAKEFGITVKAVREVLEET